MASPFRIKVCGITTEDAARAAIEAGADHLGVVLCPSPRRLTIDRAREIVIAAPASWVGVFADTPLDEIRRAALDLGLSAVQLHGSETAAECRAVREATGLPAWKAVRADRSGADARYERAVDAVLLDAGTGGSGRTLDWNAIGARFPRERRTVPILLAGGLGPDNVAEAVEAARPDGVDASSRLERVPGIKDAALVRDFVRKAREAALATRPMEASR